LGAGALAIPLSPKITVQIIKHYRNPGARATERSPWSVAFFDHRQVHFFALHFWKAIFLVFRSKILPELKGWNYPLPKKK